LENIPDNPCVILSKHQSAWETFAFQTIFPPQVWVLKKSLLFVPFFGWGLAMMNPIAIDRTSGPRALKQMLTQGKNRLKNGWYIIVFPEGTRIAPGQRGKYQIGGAWLSARLQSDIVPVAHNAGEFWPKNALLKKPGTITVTIGKPIKTAHQSPTDLIQQVEEWIETTMPNSTE
jgi:1-acyl-sn-glycerol-3-phosphate acyltransferase|tara:strand:- start:255 stop:776 length:522 start_codon:yes stop_codon:yes gene_type:complete